MTQAILDRLRYLKDVSEETEKWFDPQTEKIWWVYKKNGKRDWQNARAY